MHDDELERFKRDISLPDYAAARFGYVRDRRESSVHCHVLRRTEGDDKIVVRQDPRDEHWTYFSVRDGQDHGSILDFAQRRDRASLGQVREELRRWLGITFPRATVAIERAPRLRPTLDPARTYQAARTATRSAYLESRGLRQGTLSHALFTRTWREGLRGNVLFAHTDEDGVLTGFEIKNRGFTGFSPGGRKSAWQSAAALGDRAVVVTESAIDALSHHQLFPLQGARYLSTAGTMGDPQRATLERIFARLAPATLLVLAVDADAGGDELATRFTQLGGVDRLRIVRHSPLTGKDWNDALQSRVPLSTHSLPSELRELAEP